MVLYHHVEFGDGTRTSPAVEFLPREAIAIAVLAVVVCLSVTRRYCIKTTNAESRKQRHTSPGTLVFGCQRSPPNSNGVTPTGAPNAGG